MITGIHVRNFKSIAEVRLALRPLTVLYGKGGSGKSNLVEALLTAAGLAGGLTVEEALAEQGLHIGAAGWGGVRGGAGAAARRTAAGTKGPIDITIEGTTHVPDANGDEQPTAWRFSVGINAASRQLVNEVFTAGRPIYERDENAGGKSNEEAALRARAGIAQLSRGGRPGGYRSGATRAQLTHDQRTAREVGNELAQIQHLQLEERLLRTAGTGDGRRLDPDGGNLTRVVETILESRSGRAAYRAWMRRAGPNPVTGLRAWRDTRGRSRVAATIEGVEHESNAWGSSLLRTAATIAAFLQPDQASALVFEDIDDGVGYDGRAGSLDAISELLHTQARTQSRQLLATAKSPSAFDWAQPSDLDCIVVVDRHRGHTRAREAAQVVLECPATPEPGKVGDWLAKL